LEDDPVDPVYMYDLYNRKYTSIDLVLVLIYFIWATWFTSDMCKNSVSFSDLHVWTCWFW